MQYFVTKDVLPTQSIDCIAVAIFEEQQLSPSAAALDTAAKGLIQRVIERGDINGKPGQTMLLQDIDGIASPRVLLVGCGKFEKTTENDFNTATVAMAKWLNESSATQAISCLAETPVTERSVAWKIRQTIINTETALYRYSQTKSQLKPVEKPLERLGFMATEADIDMLEKACQTGAAIGRGMNLARELGNLPGNICTPTYLAEQAIKLGQDLDNLVVDVLEVSHQADLGLGIARGVSGEWSHDANLDGGVGQPGRVRGKYRRRQRHESGRGRYKYLRNSQRVTP